MFDYLGPVVNLPNVNSFKLNVVVTGWCRCKHWSVTKHQNYCILDWQPSTNHKKRRNSNSNQSEILSRAPRCWVVRGYVSGRINKIISERMPHLFPFSVCGFRALFHSAENFSVTLFSDAVGEVKAGLSSRTAGRYVETLMPNCTVFFREASGANVRISTVE